MEQHAHISKLGNVESDGNVRDTQHIEAIHKQGSEGKVVTPNNPRKFPEASNANLEAPNPNDEPRRHTETHVHHGSVAHKPTTKSPIHRHGYQPNYGDKRPGRISSESENSVERSPLHPRYQVKAATRGGVSSPSRGSSEGSHVVASNIAGRSRMRTGGRGDETPEKGSSVPRFGEWDESDPSSADNFTGIFNKVREEKKSGSAAMVINDTVYVNDQDRKSGSLNCCFGWCKK
ncbi:RPM1-interacting protein 4 isoform X1 [Musa acuminata AAA Group]|uniref:RPM1-interacting protein 4 isoform X1 n=1 Tax=Musa acuminata AAA Group TaxID=214697 RepID=UPI0031DF70FB